MFEFATLEKVKFTFVANEGSNEEIIIKDCLKRCILVSGGLDSLAAALKYSNKDTILLSITTGKNRVEQKKVIQFLESNTEFRKHISIGVRRIPKNKVTNEYVNLDGKQKAQNLMTRSLLYLSFATIISIVLGIKEIIIADNGIISHNLPLSVSRQPTRTTHPLTLNYFEKLVNSFFGKQIKIINPFNYVLKKEEVEIISKIDPSIIQKTRSCFNPRISNHCGECFGCLIRKISILSLDLQEFDSKYLFNCFDVQKRDRTKRGRLLLIDLILFAIKFRESNRSDIITNFPLIIIGDDNPDKVIRMYRCFCDDITNVIMKYGDSFIKKMM